MPPDTLELSHFLTFAHALADAAGEIIRPHFGAHGDVEDKADKSPVTIADKLAEKAMRKLIEGVYPAHAIFGEEYGSGGATGTHGKPSPSLGGRLDGGLVTQPQTSEPAKTDPHPTLSLRRERASSTASLSRTTHDSRLTARYTWVLDPIDGTRAFIAGRKEWGTLIALCADGVPVLGILDQPVTGERWIGIQGEPTRYSTVPVSSTDPKLRAGEMPIKTRTCAALSEAEFSTTSANYFTPEQAKHVVALAQACRATVKDGDCYAYGQLARGARDIVVDAGLKPYDILALVPIIEGAGGKITGWNGKPVTLANFRDVVAVGDAARHAEVLKLLA